MSITIINRSSTSVGVAGLVIPPSGASQPISQVTLDANPAYLRQIQLLERQGVIATIDAIERADLEHLRAKMIWVNPTTLKLESLPGSTGPHLVTLSDGTQVVYEGEPLFFNLPNDLDTGSLVVGKWYSFYGVNVKNCLAPVVSEISPVAGGIPQAYKYFGRFPYKAGGISRFAQTGRDKFKLAQDTEILSKSDLAPSVPDHPLEVSLGKFVPDTCGEIFLLSTVSAHTSGTIEISFVENGLLVPTKTIKSDSPHIDQLDFSIPTPGQPKRIFRLTTGAIKFFELSASHWRDDYLS